MYLLRTLIIFRASRGLDIRSFMPASLLRLTSSAKAFAVKTPYCTEVEADIPVHSAYLTDNILRGDTHARTLHHIKLIVKEQVCRLSSGLIFSQRNAKPIRCAFCKLIIKS